MKHNSPLLLTGAAFLLIAAAVAWAGTSLDTPDDTAGGDPVVTSVQELTDLHVDSNVQPLYVGEDTFYVFTLGAMTTAADGTVVSFNSGQMYDFVVTQDGREVWRWSDGRAFHQAFIEESFAFGELRVFTAVWDGRDANGKPVVGEVEVRGRLTSVPRLETPARALEMQEQ